MQNKTIYQKLFIYSFGIFLISCGGGGSGGNSIIQSSGYSSIAEIAAVLIIQK